MQGTHVSSRFHGYGSAINFTSSEGSPVDNSISYGLSLSYRHASVDEIISSVRSDFRATQLLSSSKGPTQVSDDSKILRSVKQILRLLNSEEYIEGQISRTEKYLESLFFKNKYAFRESFQRAWLTLFRKSNDDFANFINMCSGLPYEYLEDKADALVVAACSHRDFSVNEAAIRAIDAWSQSFHVDYLEQIRDFDISWLDEYKRKVQKRLR